MHDLLRLSAPIIPLLGLLIERGGRGGLMIFGALPILAAGALNGALDPLNALLSAALCVLYGRRRDHLSAAAALALLGFHDPRLLLAIGAARLWRAHPRRAALPLALSAAATLWAAWGGVALDLGAPPSLHLHTQAGLLIALALTSGLTFSADPLFAALLLLRGAGPLCPELLSVAGPGLIFIAPLLALLAALRPARRSEAEARRAARLSAAAVILLGGLTLTSLGLLGAAITAVILIIDLDAPRPSPLGLLPGAGLGLAYALYAAATSVTLPPLAAALTAALVLITLARGWAWRPPSLALVIALTLMAPLSTQLTTRAATRWSRQHPPSQDRWGWRALWRQSEPRPGAPDAGP